MKCVDCIFFWQGEDDDFPYCHFEGYVLPCEYDDYVSNESGYYPELNFDGCVDHHDIGSYTP